MIGRGLGMAGVDKDKKMWQNGAKQYVLRIRRRFRTGEDGECRRRRAHSGVEMSRKIEEKGPKNRENVTPL